MRGRAFVIGLVIACVVFLAYDVASRFGGQIFHCPAGRQCLVGHGPKLVCPDGHRCMTGPHGPSVVIDYSIYITPKTGGMGLVGGRPGER